MLIRIGSFCLCFLLVVNMGWAQTEKETDNQQEKIRKAIRQAVDKNLHYPVFPEKDSAKQALEREQSTEGSQSGNKERVVSEESTPESEVHAAINPQDSSNIIVSPINRATQSLLTPVYYTKDFGQTWEKSSFRPIPDAIIQNSGGGDPILTFDTEGTAYISWLSLGGNSQNELVEGIFWAFSEDGGRTWRKVGDQTIAKTTNDSRNFDTFYDKQWMDVDRTNSPFRNNLYVAYTVFNVNEGTRKIQAKVKPADSNDFNETPVTLAENLRQLQFTDIRVAPNGDVHCIFQGLQNAQGKGLYHVKSSDGGQTFTAPQKITGLAFPGTNANFEHITGIRPDRLYPCPHLAIDHSDESTRGNLYVVWTAWGINNQNQQNFDIYFTRSTDNGQSWETPTTITEGSEEHDKFYPSIAVNDRGFITVSWYQQVDGALTHYFSGYSDDGGNSFKNKHPVSNARTDFNTVGDENRGFGIGEYTKVLSTNTHAIPIWADGRDNNGNLNIMAAFIEFDNFGASGTEYRNIRKDFTVNDLYPNPAEGHLNVAMKMDKRATVDIQITNLEGKTMKRMDEKALSKGRHDMRLQLDGLKDGSYFLKIRTNEGLVAKPFQVIK